ncbi:MAG: ABC transporter ATP-binding protein, partial [Planctomycetes bacterium]|nr:ABC transporter ATP-binding protein [Planctomycetota bacterium]
MRWSCRHCAGPCRIPAVASGGAPGDMVAAMVKLLVEATALCKRFGTRWALQRVDLTVAAGELVALVGANGSGKSTLLKLLAGLLRPDGGRLTVAGHEPWREREAVMRTTRFAFAPPALFEALTGREQLVALASAGGASVAARGREVERALAALGLAARADDRVRTYSFGLRQRLTLAQALLPLPQLLVLDEPTEGLDPVAVRELRGLLRRLRDESGIAIVLASHLAAEVELLADRLVVLEEGRVAFAGPVEELLAGQEEWVLAVDRPQAAAAALVAAGFTPRPARERDRADELRVA